MHTPRFYPWTPTFIIYINDIAQASKRFDFIIYADDTTLSTTIEIAFNNAKDMNIVSKLNAELANVSDWLKQTSYH